MYVCIYEMLVHASLIFFFSYCFYNYLSSLKYHKRLSHFKICLVNIANGLNNTTVNSSGFLWQNNHFEFANA